MQKAMKGLGTDDQALVRIIISRSECDMVQIKNSFQQQFQGRLADWIKVGQQSSWRLIQHMSYFVVLSLILDAVEVNFVPAVLNFRFS